MVASSIRAFRKDTPAPGTRQDPENNDMQANIKSDNIRDQLLEKGFTSSRTSPPLGDQPENCAPPSPKPTASSAETKLQGLSNRMRQRRNALHIRNGSDEGEEPATASPRGEGNASSPNVSKLKGQSEACTALETPERGRASACTNFWSPGCPHNTNCFNGCTVPALSHRAKVERKYHHLLLLQVLPPSSSHPAQTHHHRSPSQGQHQGRTCARYPRGLQEDMEGL